MKYIASDFDSYGILKASHITWWVMLLQCYIWGVFVIASIGNETAQSLLYFVYPNGSYIIGLIPGIFWTLLLIFYPRRSVFVIQTGIAYIGVLISSVVVLINSLYYAIEPNNPDFLFTRLMLCFLNISCFIQLFPDSRNIDVFVNGGLVGKDIKRLYLPRNLRN